jgi:hypothetical protein
MHVGVVVSGRNAVDRRSPIIWLFLDFYSGRGNFHFSIAFAEEKRPDRQSSAPCIPAAPARAVTVLRRNQRKGPSPKRQARTKGRFVRQQRAWKEISGGGRALTLSVASQLPLDCLLPVFCAILGERWDDSEAIASGRYLVPRAPAHRNRPVRSRSIVRI